jgi:hypothetical protein
MQDEFPGKVSILTRRLPVASKITGTPCATSLLP